MNHKDQSYFLKLSWNLWYILTSIQALCSIELDLVVVRIDKTIDSPAASGGDLSILS